MKNDKHFNRRLWFMIGVLVVIGLLFLARLAQIQLVEGRNTLDGLNVASSSTMADSTVQSLQNNG